MEIFGIPVFMIVIAIIILITQYNEKKKENTKKWDSISTQMNKDEVLNRLGKPHRVWQAGAAEIWDYGSSDSEGVVRVINEKVMAFQKPG